MKRQITTLLVLMLTGLGLNGQTFTEWQNAYVNQVNRLENHASYKTDESTLSLDGQWKFNWVENADQRPTDFFRTDYNDSSWKTMPVPGMWELNGFGDPGEVLIYDPSRSHIQMAYLGISHLAIRKTNCQTAGVAFYKRVFLHQSVYDRCFGRSNCISPGLLTETKAIQYHQYDWFLHVYLIFFPRCSTKLISSKRRIFVILSDFRTRITSSFSNTISLCPSKDTIFC